MSNKLSETIIEMAADFKKKKSRLLKLSVICNQFTGEHCICCQHINGSATDISVHFVSWNVYKDAKDDFDSNRQKQKVRKIHRVEGWKQELLNWKASELDESPELEPLVSTGEHEKLLTKEQLEFVHASIPPDEWLAQSNEFRQKAEVFLAKQQYINQLKEYRTNDMLGKTEALAYKHFLDNFCVPHFTSFIFERPAERE